MSYSQHPKNAKGNATVRLKATTIDNLIAKSQAVFVKRVPCKNKISQLTEE